VTFLRDKEDLGRLPLRLGASWQHLREIAHGAACKASHIFNGVIRAARKEAKSLPALRQQSVLAEKACLLHVGQVAQAGKAIERQERVGGDVGVGRARLRAARACRNKPLAAQGCDRLAANFTAADLCQLASRLCGNRAFSMAFVISNFHAFKLRERVELSKGGRQLLQGRVGEELDT
jgi:hypothetical protein